MRIVGHKGKAAMIMMMNRLRLTLYTVEIYTVVNLRFPRQRMMNPKGVDGREIDIYIYRYDGKICTYIGKLIDIDLYGSRERCAISLTRHERSLGDLLSIALFSGCSSCMLYASHYNAGKPEGFR